LKQLKSRPIVKRVLIHTPVFLCQYIRTHFSTTDRRYIKTPKPFTRTKLCSWSTWLSLPWRECNSSNTVLYSCWNQTPYQIPTRCFTMHGNCICGTFPNSSPHEHELQTPTKTLRQQRKTETQSLCYMAYRTIEPLAKLLKRLSTNQYCAMRLYVCKITKLYTTKYFILHMMSLA